MLRVSTGTTYTRDAEEPYVEVYVQPFWDWLKYQTWHHVIERLTPKGAWFQYWHPPWKDAWGYGEMPIGPRMDCRCYELSVKNRDLVFHQPIKSES